MIWAATVLSWVIVLYGIWRLISPASVSSFGVMIIEDAGCGGGQWSRALPVQALVNGPVRQPGRRTNPLPTLADLPNIRAGR
jgi:hypothetical protein